MTVTFKDVAELAGVSTQTVSRVTNGATNVAQETKEKVLKAIQELGYVPNQGAQMLSRSKSKIVGLITLDMGLHGASLIANGVRQKAQEMDYAVSFSVVSEKNSSESLLKSIQELKAQRIELVVVNIPLDKEQCESLVANHRDMKFVFIDVPVNAKVYSVSSDDRQGAILAVELFLKQGRSRPILIAGPRLSDASEKRRQAWVERFAHDNISPVETYHCDWDVKQAYQAISSQLVKGVEFDCVLVGNDQMALGVLLALNEAKIAIPDQVAVIGFDDTDDSAYFFPPLTTIHQDLKQIGEKALDILFNLQTDREPEEVLVSVQLKERKSSGVKASHQYSKDEVKALLRKVEHLLP